MLKYPLYCFIVIIMKHKSYILNLFIVFVGLFPASSYCVISPFQTTRLKSTAGTGIATLAIDEASILNPAPLAFFKDASIYFQKSQGNITNDNEPLQSWETGNTAFIASDTQNFLKGSVSYIRQFDGLDQRTQLGVSLASIIGPQSSLGLTLQKNKNPGKRPNPKSRMISIN